MSIQFRSRIKPALNYSPILNSFGYCCSSENPGSPVPKSFIECFNEAGHFIPSVNGQQPTCPDPDRSLGCCCSCSYVIPSERSQVPRYDSNNPPNPPYLASGIRNNVDKCTCDILNGKWTAGECPDLTEENYVNLCVGVDLREPNKPEVDVRLPRGCCHLGFDETTGWPTGIQCTNVCNSYECSLLGTDAFASVANGYSSVFSPDRTCIQSARPPATEGDLDSGVFCGYNYRALMANINPIQFNLDPEHSAGSCFELRQNESGYYYTCRVTSMIGCGGWWENQQSVGKTLYCEIKQKPKNPVRKNGGYQVQEMSLTEFQDIGINIGDRFQGGIYIGIFNSPAGGRSSEVYGNLSFGQPILSRFENDNVSTTTATKWALVAHNKTYYVPFLTEGEDFKLPQTSLFDGHYNTYGDENFNGINTNLTTSFKNIPKTAFLDYYIPSIYELNFYAAYLKNKNIKNKGILLSSSIFNAKYIGLNEGARINGGSNYVYCQSIFDEINLNYKNTLSDLYTVQNLILFRRIVLTE